MKKIMYLLVAVCSLPAMEMKEFKKGYHEVPPQLLAAVIQVPAVSKMLAKHYVTCPIDFSQATYQDECIKVSTLKNTEDRFHAPSPNYFCCPTPKGGTVGNAGIDQVFNRSKYIQNSKICRFYFDGPNKNGLFISSSMLDNNDHIRMVNDDKLLCSAPNRVSKQNTWSAALSEHNVAAFSSVSTTYPYAFLELFKCNQKINTYKILGFSRTEKNLTMDSKKLLVLKNRDFHVFSKMSFLSDDLMLGLDQNGQLYTIQHYFEDKERPATFHHLAFDKNKFSSILHYGLDSYDKHSILMIDNNNDVRIGKITADKLITKKIRRLDDIKNAIKRSGNTFKDLARIRMAGNVCYFIFEGQTAAKQIQVTFRVVSKQPSSREKISMIKAQMA